jgi:hypothetical protein
VSGTPHPGGMQPPETADGTLIAAEAARYLSAVEVFRREGHEPCWEAEGHRLPVSLQRFRAAARVVPTSERSKR